MIFNLHFRDFVSDFDLMIERKKAEQRRQKGNKRKDGDLINDNDDLIADMICKMKEAAEVKCYGIKLLDLQPI